MTKITLPTERQVGHLRLLRHAREINLAEFNKLTSPEQLDIIRSVPGKEKYNLITNAHQADKLVPKLHPQEIYLLVNELGAEDVPELLNLASPEQINLLLDMDCWDGDNLSSVLTLHWLELLLNTSHEKICQLIRDLEPEILALFLKKHLTITHGIEVFDSDEIDNAKRLESLYDIDYASEKAAKVIGALLRIWMEQEQDCYLLVMEMIRSELLTCLEEEVYQTRNNRLLDIGILPGIEAKSLYTYVAPDQFTPGGKVNFQLEAEELNSPKGLLANAEPCNLLADILAAGIDHAAACELLLLVNRKMSADNIDLSAVREVSETIQSTYDTLNLALEYLSGKNADTAEKIFTSTYLLRLFQLGHSLIEQRRRKAVDIASSSIYLLLDYPEVLFIDSLLETPPFLYVVENSENPASLQPIRTIRELDIVDLRLEQIERLLSLFNKHLPFSVADFDTPDNEAPSLSQIFITAVANQLLGRDFSPFPLSVEDLKSLKKLTLPAESLSPEFIAQFKAGLNAHIEDLDFFTNYCLDLWHDSFIDDDAQLSGFITTGQ